MVITNNDNDYAVRRPKHEATLFFLSDCNKISEKSAGYFYTWAHFAHYRIEFCCKFPICLDGSFCLIQLNLKQPFVTPHPLIGLFEHHCRKLSLISFL